TERRNGRDVRCITGVPAAFNDCPESGVIVIVASLESESPASPITFARTSPVSFVDVTSTRALAPDIAGPSTGSHRDRSAHAATAGHTSDTTNSARTLIVHIDAR